MIPQRITMHIIAGPRVVTYFVMTRIGKNVCHSLPVTSMCQAEQRVLDEVPYETYPIELTAYCLMDNHFHLLMYQETDPEALTRFMRSVSTAYTMYFNRKYRRNGHLFQSVFKASRIDNESYLLHITRYIHMNPRRYLRYRWSSAQYYLGEPAPRWLNLERVNDMSPQAYRQFLKEYEGKKIELQKIKDQLSHS